MINENNNSGGPNNNENQNDNNKSSKNGLIAAIIATLLIFLFVCWIRDELEQSAKQEITYDAFLKMLDEKTVQKVEFSGNKITITPTTQENAFYIVTYYTGYVNDDSLVERLNKAGVEYKSVVEDNGSSILEFLMWNVFPFFLIFGTMWLLFRPMFKGGGMMGVGKTNAKGYVEKERQDGSRYGCSLYG